MAEIADAARGLRVYTRDKLRLTVAVAVLAIGVGLGLAIDLVNGAALTELSASLVALSGEADLAVRGPRSGVDESLLGELARLPEVAAVSPVVEFQAVDARGRELTILGIDAFRAALVERALVPSVNVADRMSLLAPDSLFLGPDILRRWGLSIGQTLELRAPAGALHVRIAGALTDADPGVSDVGVMDIAPAQLYGASVGRLSRIDVRARPGISAESLQRALGSRLPPGVVVQSPRGAAASDLRVSRAYRINLTVLALVALFCGSLLIFSAQAVQLARRRPEFALLRALGLTRAGLVRRLLLEAALIGVPASALGVLLGYALATVALRYFGGDLGAGFFRGVAPRVEGGAWSTAVYFAAGVGAAVAGAWFPALEAARMAPARGLRSGSQEDAYRPIIRVTPGACLIACGGLALLLPHIDDLPLGGYLGIACILVGAVAMVPGVLAAVVRLVPARRAIAVLARAQLRGAPAAPAISLAAVVGAMSLAVAVMIMVHSFRVSFQEWLVQILPADAYVGGAGLRLSPQDQARVAASPAVARAEFLRTDEVRLANDRPPVALLARDIDPLHPENRLPVVADAPRRSGATPVWVSESVAAVYHLAAGSGLALPVAGHRVDVVVAGIFRDYGRQQGAIVMERAMYRQISGDATANNAALWLRAGHGLAELKQSLDWLGSRAEVRDTSAIRELSVGVFDRTFAITYALVAVAMTMGLAALGANMTALIVARRYEFAVLRHLGMRRREIVRMLLAQSSMIVGTGLAMGAAIGLVIGAILIYVINRQSFHWTMGFHVPGTQMAVAAAAVMLLALLVTAVSARGALTGAVLRSVAEDW